MPPPRSYWFLLLLLAFLLTGCSPQSVRSEAGSSDGDDSTDAQAERTSPSTDEKEKSAYGTDWYDDHEAVPWSEAVEYPTKHYLIKTNIKAVYATRYGKMMDQYYEAFRRLLPNLPEKEPRERSRLVIYSDRAEFIEQTGVAQGVGGFYSTASKQVTTYHGRFGTTGTTRTILAHEGTHQFQDRLAPLANTPIWLLEGFAVYFESTGWDSRTEELMFETLPADRLRPVQRGLRTGHSVPLTELIRTPLQTFGGLHYAHAWSFIQFLAEENGNTGGKNQTSIAKLFKLARERRVTPADVVETFGGREAFESLEERWKEWVLDQNGKSTDPSGQESEN